MKSLNHQIFRKIFFAVLILRREWFIPRMRDLLESQYCSIYALRKMQLKRLNELLTHAAENVPFYENRIPHQIENLDQLSDLPFLHKSDVREKTEELTYKVGLHQRFKTSGGSTGAPVTLVKDSSGMAQEMAAMWRGYSWAGVEIGHRQARFWGVPKSRKERMRSQLIDFICNRYRVTAFNFDVKAMQNEAKKLEQFRPDYFYGYTSIIKEFALAQDGAKTTFQPKAIITTSEVLTPGDRELLESTFSCRVFDEYGCGEVGTIAHECEHGSLHLNSENLIVETIDAEGNPVKPGESGELVVTDLTNWSMPLIRYRLEDFGELASKPCSCGRGLAVLKNIHGRAYDIIENSAGKKFHGEFFLYIAEDTKKLGLSVDGIQFVKMRKHNLIVNLMCPEDQFHKIKNYVESRLIRDFDANFKYSVSRVKSLMREKSGKLRVVKSVDNEIGDG